jgi:hypothetical protein
VFSPAPVTCRPNATLPFGRNDWKSSALRVELKSPTWRGAHAPTVPPRHQPEVGETTPRSSATILRPLARQRKEEEARRCRPAPNSICAGHGAAAVPPREEERACVLPCAGGGAEGGGARAALLCARSPPLLHRRLGGLGEEECARKLRRGPTMVDLHGRRGGRGRRPTVWA